MALSKTPGPEGLWKHSQGIGPGTLAKTLSPTPGPIGLQVRPDGLKASPQTAAPPCRYRRPPAIENNGIGMGEENKGKRRCP